MSLKREHVDFNAGPLHPVGSGDERAHVRSTEVHPEELTAAEGDPGAAGSPEGREQGCDPGNEGERDGPEEDEPWVHAVEVERGVTE